MQDVETVSHEPRITLPEEVVLASAELTYMSPAMEALDMEVPTVEQLFDWPENTFVISDEPYEDEWPNSDSAEVEGTQPLESPETFKAGTDVLEHFGEALELTDLPLQETIMATVEQMEPETQAVVYELLETIITASEQIYELRMSGDETALAAEQELQLRITELLELLQIEPTDENIHIFVRTLRSFVNDQQHQAEGVAVDEGTHERKTELSYLQQLMQLAKEPRLPHVHLGRLACQWLVPAA